MKLRLSLGFCVLISMAALAAQAGDAGPSVEAAPWLRDIPGAKRSVYTEKMKDILRYWPPAGFGNPAAASGGSDDKANPIWFEAIRTPSDSNYIGSRKRLLIRAPLDKVKAVIDDFENYKNIFEGVIQAKITERAGSQVTTAWERDSPAFFIRNPRYEQIYVSEAVSPSRVFYRYQLKSGNSVNFVDGIMVLESTPLGTTLSGYDFYQADWGLAKVLAEGKIWRESLEGGFRGDIALKTKVEHPDWTLKQITEECHRTLERFPIEPIRFSEGLNTK